MNRDDLLTFARAMDNDFVWMHNVVTGLAWPSPSEQVQTITRGCRERLRYLLNAVEPGLADALGESMYAMKGETTTSEEGE